MPIEDSTILIIPIDTITIESQKYRKKGLSSIEIHDSFISIRI